MALTFSGNVGVGAQATYLKNDYNSATYGVAGTAGQGGWKMGGVITPTTDYTLSRVYWYSKQGSDTARYTYTFPTVPGFPTSPPASLASSYSLYIWGPDDEVLFTKNIPGSNFISATYAIAEVPNIRLRQGQSYRLAIATGDYRTLIPTTVQTNAAGTNPYITFGAAINSAYDPEDRAEAPSTSGTSWRTSFQLVGTILQTVTQATPPDPQTLAGPQQFGIAINRNWFAASVQEWTLQYSKSSTGVSGWSDWTTLGTFQLADNLFLHTSLDPFDKPYYRYRYKVASASEESSWSEETYAGRPVNAVVTDDNGVLDLSELVPSGSIGSDKLNISEIAAISANLGKVTSGHIIGPLIETSESHPKITIAQNAGLRATDSAGDGVFDLDAVTGALTLKGDITTGSIITGSTVRTGTTGARVVMDTVGLTAYATNGTTKLLEYKTSDGSLALTGAITGSTITGSTLTGGTVQTSSSGSRVVMSSAGIVGYATNGTTERFKLDTATGLLSLNGTLITAAGSIIDGTYIAANTVTTAKLSATAIDGMTVTGATVRTGTSGQRVEMDSGKLALYEADGTTVGTQLVPGGGMTLLASELVSGEADSGSPKPIITDSWEAPRTVSWEFDSARIGTLFSPTTSGYELRLDAGQAFRDDPASVSMNALSQTDLGHSAIPITASLRVASDKGANTADVAVKVETSSDLFEATVLNQLGESSFMRYAGATTPFTFTSPWANLGGPYQTLKVFTMPTLDGQLILLNGLIKTTGNVNTGATILTGLPHPIDGVSVANLTLGQLSTAVTTNFWYEISSSGAMSYAGDSAVTWAFAPINLVYLAAA